ncbi:MAG: PepSY-associated TM helix domain-containing protein [Gammaproteobacteria bacterium]
MNPVTKNRPKTRGGYLFLPKRWARGHFLKWLRRAHGWIGLWGASLGLLFGGTGILLNHHDVLKISATRVERTEVQLTLPSPLPVEPKALAAWLGQEYGLNARSARIHSEPVKTVTWNGVSVQLPPRWQITLRTPKQSVQAEYWPGNRFVTVKLGNGNLFSLLSNLHKGVGMGLGWVLLADTLAGGLIVLSLSGILLWTRLHGGRLTAAGLGLGSLGLALGFSWQALGG